jgi:hypothetical protein
MSLDHGPETDEDRDARHARLGHVIAEALQANCAECGVDAAALDAACIIGSAIRFVLEAEGPRAARDMVQWAKESLAAAIANKVSMTPQRLN